jgi:hypothetical protein
MKKPQILRWMLWTVLAMSLIAAIVAGLMFGRGFSGRLWCMVAALPLSFTAKRAVKHLVADETA